MTVEEMNAQEDKDDDLYLWNNLGVHQTRFARKAAYNRMMDRRDRVKATVDE